jgi:hypothetical protein
MLAIIQNTTELHTIIFPLHIWSPYLVANILTDTQQVLHLLCIPQIYYYLQKSR